MEAAVASNIPSSFRFSSPTNSPCIPTVFNLKGHLNLKCQSIPTGIEWKTRRIVKASQSASAFSDRSGSASARPNPIAPLQLESPMGQFLYEVLKIDPGLVHDAAEWQLQQLQRARDADEHKEDSSEPLLYRRIAEVKANERKKAVEEILYVLVVLKFMDANVSLIPKVRSPPLVNWPSLGSMDHEKLHSPEAYKMMMKHLALNLGSLFDDSTKTKVTKVSRLMIRQLYARYLLYGYFVKGLDARFQLEKTMKILPYASDGGDNKANNYDDSLQSVDCQPEASCLDLGSSGRRKEGEKLTPLGSYAKSIDPEMLMKFTAIRSEEGVSIAQKHIQALFGDEEEEEEDDVVKISLGGVKRLLLEAVTFGYLLWDVESFVDCRLPFVSN